jgi:hypothetical protein
MVVMDRRDNVTRISVTYKDARVIREQDQMKKQSSFIRRPGAISFFEDFETIVRTS